MRALEFIHARFRERLGSIHAARWQALWRVVAALLIGRKLWLTALGRTRPGTAMPKHGIKAVDRLLGNVHLYKERFEIAACVVETIVGPCRCPIVLVDTVELRHKVVALTAAVAHDGRSFPIWSTLVKHVRPQARDCQRFLDELSRVLPVGTRAIIVSDAGFEGAWFAAVQRLGWDYVGRLRGQVQVERDGVWVQLRTLRSQATRRAKNLGTLNIGKRRSAPHRVVLSKLPSCGHRQVKTRRGPARGTNYHVYRQNAHEPLVLVTSLRSRPDAIVDFYKLRMQIEQAFRDLKNHRWGWSLRHCGTRRRARIELLLLIAAIACLVQQLVGIAAEARGLQRAHQANTERARRVLSFFVLGALVLNRSADELTTPEIRSAIDRLRRAVATHPS